ncbi:unnamed protein product [Closterium sp. NIES-54]
MDAPAVLDCAVSVILQLTQSYDGALEVVDVGGVGVLVDLVDGKCRKKGGGRDGGSPKGDGDGAASKFSESVRSNAAAALFAIATCDDDDKEDEDGRRRRSSRYRNKILRCGGIPPLLKLLKLEAARCRKDAALALFALSDDPDCADEIIREGGVSVLVDSLSDKRPGVEEKAMAVLANLVKSKEGQAALLEVEGTLVMLDVLESESERAQEEALFALYHLVTTGVVTPAFLLNDGALFPVAKMAAKKGSPPEALELHKILTAARKSVAT